MSELPDSLSNTSFSVTPHFCVKYLSTYRLHLAKPSHVIEISVRAVGSFNMIGIISAANDLCTTFARVRKMSWLEFFFSYSIGKFSIYEEFIWRFVNGVFGVAV